MYSSYLTVAIILFALGFLGVLLRRNLVVLLLCIELMLNSVSLIFVSASRYLPESGGSSPEHGLIFVFFVLTISAAEVAVGLALVITIFRRWDSINIDEFSELKW